MAGDPAEADVFDVGKLFYMLDVWIVEMSVFYCF